MLTPDFDMYRDFNNLDQYDAATMPPYVYDYNKNDHVAAMVPPMSSRMVGQPLIHFPNAGETCPGQLDDSFVQSMQQQDRGNKYGYSFISDNSKLSLPGPSDLAVELMNITPFGAEYTDEERLEMTRKQQRRRWMSKKAKILRDWGRGKQKPCGWFGPKVVLISLFVLICMCVHGETLTQPCHTSLLLDTTRALYVRMCVS